jgi:ATP-binding cassette subfamily B protein
MIKKCLNNFKSTALLYISNGILQIFISTYAIVFFQKLIDSIEANNGIKISISLLIGYGVLQLLDYILNYLDNYFESKLKNGIYYELKIMAIKKISTIDFLSYKKFGTGKLVQLIENGANAGRDIIFSFYLNIFRYLLPSLIFGIVFIGIYDLKVLIAVAISYIIVFLFTKLLLRKLYAVKNSALINEESFTGKLIRSFIEMVVLRIGVRYKREINSAQKTANKIVNNKTRILMTHEAFFTVFAILVVLIKITAIYIGITQIAKGNSTIGSVIAITALIDRIYEPIAIFNVEYVDYKLNKIAFSRFDTLLNEKDDENLLTEHSFSEKNYNSITFENVSFTYENIKTVDNFTYVFIKGKSYVNREKRSRKNYSFKPHYRSS